MKKIISVLLIVLSVVLGYQGINKLNNSGGSVEVVGVELSATDEGKKTMGFVYLGIAVITLVAGVGSLRK